MRTALQIGTWIVTPALLATLTLGCATRRPQVPDTWSTAAQQADAAASRAETAAARAEAAATKVEEAVARVEAAAERTETAAARVEAMVSRRMMK
jgi:predicted Zn-dependent protease